MSRKNQSYSVTIFGSSSGGAYGLENRATAIKKAKALAEELKGKTIEMYGSWSIPTSMETQHEMLRYRWDDEAGKVKERR